jgi:hypothetical protein
MNLELGPRCFPCVTSDCPAHQALGVSIHRQATKAKSALPSNNRHERDCGGMSVRWSKPVLALSNLSSDLPRTADIIQTGTVGPVGATRRHGYSMKRPPTEAALLTRAYDKFG